MKDIKYIDDISNDMLNSTLGIKVLSMLSNDLDSLLPEKFNTIYSELINHIKNPEGIKKHFDQFLSETADLIKTNVGKWKERGGNAQDIDNLNQSVSTLQEFNTALNNYGGKISVPFVQNMDGLENYVKEYSVEQAVKNNNYVAKKLGIQGESLTLVPQEIMDKVVLGGMDIDKAAKETLTPDQNGSLTPQASFDEQVRQKREKEEQEQRLREELEQGFASPEAQRQRELERQQEMQRQNTSKLAM